MSDCVSPEPPTPPPHLERTLKITPVVSFRTTKHCEFPYFYDLYSESQIYIYIARVFYNIVFSTYLRSNAAEKRAIFQSY